MGWLQYMINYPTELKFNEKQEPGIGLRFAAQLVEAPTVGESCNQDRNLVTIEHKQEIELNIRSIKLAPILIVRQLLHKND